MGYIEKNVLSNGETIVFKPEKCKIPLFWAWVAGILFCWVLLIPTISAIKKTIEFKHIEFAVTNKKVIEKYGWLHTHCDEMLLSRVENVTVNKSFGGGLFHYGDVCIQGANRNNVNFRGVKDPEGVRRQINDVIPA